MGYRGKPAENLQAGNVHEGQRYGYLVGAVRYGYAGGRTVDLQPGRHEAGRGAILVRNGKGGKPWTVFIGKKTRQALRRYLKHRKVTTRLCGLPTPATVLSGCLITVCVLCCEAEQSKPR